MKLIKSLIRPEKLYDVLSALEKEGFKAATSFDVSGRGKQGGVQVGETSYNELLKTMLWVAVDAQDVKKVSKIIMDTANTGIYGDGKVFVSNLEEVYTIRTKQKGI